MMAQMEKCRALVRRLLCISAHYSVSGRLTLLSDLMAVGLLSNNTDPTEPHPVIFTFCSGSLCMCVHVLCVHACESV